MTTLINTPQGVIAVVDERPKYGEYYAVMDIGPNILLHNIYGHYKSSLIAEDNDYRKIIASTFGVGKELIIPEVWLLLESSNGPYEYTETENLIVIKL